MATEKIMQGNDVPMRTFKIKDSNGSLINIDDINDYQIFIYSVANSKKTNLFTFKKTPDTDKGEKAIAVVDTTTIGFVIDRTQTKNKTGVLYAELKIRMTATSDYISSLQNSGADGYEVAELVEGAAPNSLL